jgi:hypothetical protein
MYFYIRCIKYYRLQSDRILGDAMRKSHPKRNVCKFSHMKYICFRVIELSLLLMPPAPALAHTNAESKQ